MARTPFHSVVGIALGLTLAGSLALAQDGPKLVSPEPIFDAGVVVKGKIVSHSFPIENQGSSALEIREVRPACGCTVARYDETIQPGETGHITAEVSTNDFRGPVAKYVTVFSNDRNNPSVRLTIRADVRPTLDILPGYGRYIHVNGTAPKAQSQTLWATDGTQLDVTDAQSTLPFNRRRVPSC